MNALILERFLNYYLFANPFLSNNPEEVDKCVTLIL